MSRLTFLLLGCLGLVFVAAPGPSRSTPPATPTPTLPLLQSTPSPTRPLPTATPASLASPTAAAASEQLDQPELRAVWVDAFHNGFKTPQQVDDLVAWARDANLNALFVQVRRRGDAYYLNSFEPRTEDPDLAPGFDALQYLIERAHQGPHRLQIHAWLAALPIWGARDTPPVAANHPFNLRGTSAAAADTWLMYRDDGETWAGSGPSGIYYLDPGNPEVQSYTTEVSLSLLRNYDVDGIHLDQVRYYEGGALRWGYNPTSVARFDAQYGLDSSTQPAPSDPRWVAWRRDQVTALVRRIYLGAKAIKPGVAVTAAVVAWGKGPQTADDWQAQPPFASVLQDWRGWLEEGIVDYVLPMDYYREAGEQSAWFDTWTQWQVSHPGKRGVVLGMGSYLNTADGALAQLGRARGLGALGVALYSYAVPTADLRDATRDEREAFAAQLRSVFTRPAPVPDLPAPLTVSQP
ncbi:MAG: family 10 glycosylhydrolase [Chloroflexota bacterium]|nr:family 10 glycosylhydrolase [Chloroflexota bacterium]